MTADLVTRLYVHRFGLCQVKTRSKQRECLRRYHVPCGPYQTTPGCTHSDLHTYKYTYTQRHSHERSISFKMWGLCDTNVEPGPLFLFSFIFHCLAMLSMVVLQETFFSMQVPPNFGCPVQPNSLNTHKPGPE